MGKFELTNTTASDMENRVDEYEVSALNMDNAGDQEETQYINSKWATQWGYFNSIPELKSAIIMKAIWDVGKGYTCDTETQVILDHILGWGKDTFQDILFNAQIVKRIGGDSFVEIIRNEESDELINLKPLDPSTMKIVVNREGIIKRYEQINKQGKGKTRVLTFKPEQILHFSNNRLGDQIHGISDIDALEDTIKAEAENFADMKKIMHRQAKPMIMFKLGTDKKEVIDAFVAKMDAATNKGENIYIPDDENAVGWEVVQVDVSSVVLAWRDDLRNKFYRSVGLPQIVPGGAGQSTESESKVIYLAFEQIVEHDQLEIENAIWQQLYLRINLNPPATLQQNLQTDNSKDASQGLGFQPGEMQAGVGK